MTPLEFQPESFDAMTQRWAGALMPVYELEQVTNGQQLAPGLQRRHVFDLSDGVRLIVSQERHPMEHRTVLHVSFLLNGENHHDWNRRKFLLRVGGILGRLDDLGLVRGIPLDSETTDKAMHYFYTVTA